MRSCEKSVFVEKGDLVLLEITPLSVQTPRAKDVHSAHGVQLLGGREVDAIVDV